MEFMTASEFGRKLIQSRDLDPVYMALETAEIPANVKARLCLAYWCLYHLGAAAQLAERQTDLKYWDGLRLAAVNKPNVWPRGAERRHWRGQQAVDSVTSLYSIHKDPEWIVRHWGEGKTFEEVSRRIRVARGFGPWIAFKAADMLERCLKYSIDFSDCELGIYSEPRKGAALYWRGDENAKISPEEVKLATLKLQHELRVQLAPPDFKRGINVQEVESVFCKWKSYRHERYWVGKDILEVRHSLEGWGDLAQHLQNSMPREVRRT